MLRWLVLYSLPVVLAAFVFQATTQWRNRQTRPLNATQLMAAVEIPEQSESIHLIVLVHGWLGNALEMDYLKESLLRQIPYHTDGGDGDSSKEKFIVHASVCNQGQTNDGIAAGGSRLAAEINEIVRYIRTKNKNNNAQITLSIVGNSLGGLYGRYALSEIEWQAPTNEMSSKTTTTKSSATQQQRRQRLIPRSFVTTATPHLGVNQHTYIRLPRSIEYPIAQVMQSTGRDLFRFTSVIDEMTFEAKFLAPLLQFEERIAYVNVYGTDFQVPTPTAGFWAETESRHRVVSSMDVLEEQQQQQQPSDIIMRLETEQSSHEELLFLKTKQQGGKKSYDSTVDVKSLSKQLDEVGWTKVLVDVRNHLPSVSMGSSKSRDGNNKNGYDRIPTEKDTWTSRELLEHFGGMRQGKYTLIPLGHTVLVANAKDAFNRWVTRGGKPVMDHLALSLIQSAKAKVPASIE